MGSKARPARKADNLTVIYEPIVKTMWDPQRLTTLWAFSARYKDSFTFTFYNEIKRRNLHQNLSDNW
jgi:hypothetical protein